MVGLPGTIDGHHEKWELDCSEPGMEAHKIGSLTIIYDKNIILWNKQLQI